MTERCVSCGRKYGLKRCAGKLRCLLCRLAYGLTPDAEGAPDD